MGRERVHMHCCTCPSLSLDAHKAKSLGVKDGSDKKLRALIMVPSRCCLPC